MATINISNTDLCAVRRLKRRMGNKGLELEKRQDACVALYDHYLARGQTQRALMALFYSFSLAKPRADIACKVGSIFLETENIESAILWSRIALDLMPNSDEFEIEALLQLCRCYYSLGEIDKANYYNERARDINSTHPRVLLNRRLMNKL